MARSKCSARASATPQSGGRTARIYASLPARRAAMWSATRSALAMIVSVGFTAELETKKLESTT